MKARPLLHSHCRVAWALFFLLFTTTLPVAASRALPSSASTDEWLINTWEDEEGPPEYSATAMVQTSDGYLWFGTFGGLMRFDGTQLMTLAPDNTPQLPSAGIVNLHLDHRGRLWISSYRGLVRHDDTQWRQFGTNDGWAGDYVRTFAERANGDLLLTTFDGHVLEFSRDRLVQLPAPPGDSTQGYLAHVDEAGRWWVIQNRFIGKWDGERWLPTVTAGNLDADAVGCGPARDGGMWLLLRNELRRYRQGAEVSRRQLPQQPGGFWSMIEDSRGNVWIATYDKGLCQVTPDGRVQRWTMSNGLPADGVRFVFEDRENDLWVGTSAGGLTRFKPRRVHSVGQERGLTASVNCVCLDGADGLWVGTYGGGLFHWSSAGLTNVPFTGVSKPPAYLQSLLMDRAGRLWLGSFREGLWLVEGQTARAIPFEQTGGNNVIALFEDSRGRVWISGGGAGISFFDGKDFRCFGEEQGVARRAVVCFAEDSQGAIWFSDEAGVFRLEDERFVEVRTANNDSVRGIACFKTDVDGTVWMGSLARGLWRWRDGRWTTLNQQTGLPRTVIQSILEDHEGHWWLASDLGILRVARTNLQAVADGKARSLNWQTLDRSDGLASLAFAAERQPACARDTRGRLWFATGKGLAMIDPKEFRLNSVAPDVHIERVVYRLPAQTAKSGRYSAGKNAEIEVSTNAPFAEPLHLPHGSHRLEIHYAATAFSAPERVRFQVKLEGQDADWHDVDGKRAFEFYELPPDAYTFRVRAANNDGVWNEAGASLAFTIQPFYWQTSWFRMAVVFMLINTGGLAAWGRSRLQYRRKLEQWQRARRHEQELAHVARVSTMGELAASVAHELNQPLGAILSNAEAAEMFLNATPPALDDVREILVDIRKDDERAGEVIRRMHALLRKREMEMEPIELNSVVEDVFGLVSADAALRKTAITAELSQRLPRIRGDRIHLQQVLLNLMVNAMEAMSKQAPEKRRVLVRSSFNGNGSVEVAVADSGPGIEAEKAARLFEPFFTTKKNGMGMGLSIARRIIEAHHGRIWVESNPAGGATFKFTLPVGGDGNDSSAGFARI